MAYRRVGEEPGATIEVVLVTSRQTRRWIIPKGNVDDGMAPHAAAAQEAEEEAGVCGDIGRDPIGSFDYDKRIVSGLTVRTEVTVYPLAVRAELNPWREQQQRRRRWHSIEEAIDAVEEPGLRDLIRSFMP